MIIISSFEFHFIVLFMEWWKITRKLWNRKIKLMKLYFSTISRKFLSFNMQMDKKSQVEEVGTEMKIHKSG